MRIELQVSLEFFLSLLFFFFSNNIVAIICKYFYYKEELIFSRKKKIITERYEKLINKEERHRFWKIFVSMGGRRAYILKRKTGSNGETTRSSFNALWSFRASCYASLPPFRTPTPPSVQILCLRFRVLTFKYDLTEAFELYSSRKISTAAIQRSFVDSLPTPFLPSFLLSNISPSSSLSIFVEKKSLFELAVIRYPIPIQSNSTV